MTVLLLAIATLVVTGCSTITTTRNTTTSTLLGASSTPASAGVLATNAALNQTRLGLARALGMDVIDIQPVSSVPQAPEANLVLEWKGGRAEVDAATGIVYVAATAQSQADGSVPLMVLDRLRYEAYNVMNELGWTSGALSGLGFREQGAGALSEGTGLYTMVWARYDSKGVQRSGSILLGLDGRTGNLASLSASLGSDSPAIEGAISEATALRITETEIYLRTEMPKGSPKLSLAGDGSLLLLGRTLSEQLTTVRDSKIVKKATLCWVVTLRGTVGTIDVGATVYIDAMSGKVLKYEAYKSDKPTTTTTSLEG